MALRSRLHDTLRMYFEGCYIYSRQYSKKVDFKKLRPMILKRIQDRAKDYPIRRMIPVAKDVLKARAAVIHGLSVLLKVFPVLTCSVRRYTLVGKVILLKPAVVTGGKRRIRFIGGSLEA
ncbi:hypothetical protein QQ045_026533 [Rhodiola kirilowii]